MPRPPGSNTARPSPRCAAPCGCGPSEAPLRVNLAKALFAIGHVSEAVREYARAWREGDAATRAAALRNLAVIAPGDPEIGNAAILEIRRHWAEAEAAGVTPIAPTHRPGRRLRLAYYGAFFHERNWMKMYMGVLNAHDRDRFELHLIADGPPPSAEAGYRDHPEDRIWEVEGIGNAELARHIADAGIDVLVDLNGYSHQARLALLLHRAAPVQIAWNGMYGTTGLPHLDALVGDPGASRRRRRNSAASRSAASPRPICRSTSSTRRRTSPRRPAWRPAMSPSAA
jgi:protein O-GlcNAc transferase